MNIKLQMHCSSKEVACAPAPTATMIDYYKSTKYEVESANLLVRPHLKARVPAAHRF